MRIILPILAVAALWAIDPAPSRAQSSDSAAVGYADVMPLALPGWPPTPQPRQIRGLFGDRVLGQPAAPRTSISRFYAQGQRDTSGAFRGIGTENRGSATARTSVVARPTLVRTPTVPSLGMQILLESQPRVVPEQPQTQPTTSAQTLPEQPLPEALREQMQSEP